MRRTAALAGALVALTCGCQGQARPVASGTLSTTAPPTATTTSTSAQAEPAAVLSPGPLYSKAAARARATAVLDLVTLPGATRVSSGDPSLGGPPEGTDDPQQIDVHTFWTAPGDKTTYLARLIDHPPAGFGMGGYAGSATQPVWAVFHPSLGQVGEVYVTAANDAGHVDLRVDVSDSWVTPRSADTIIPSTVTQAVLDYTGPSSGSPGSGPGDQDSTAKPGHAHRTLTGEHLTAIAADLNALIPESLASRSCLAGFGEAATVAVDHDGHHLVFAIEIGGCGDTTPTIDGHTELNLGTSDQLTTDIYAAIGVTRTPIPHVPPQGPPVRTKPPAITVLERNAVQAMRTARDDNDGVAVPHDSAFVRDAGVVARPPYTGPGSAVNWTQAFSIQGTMDQLVAWFRAYPAKGTVAAEPFAAKDGIRRLVMERVDRTVPVKVLTWVSMEQRGDLVVWRVDTQAAWKS